MTAVFGAAVMIEAVIIVEDFKKQTADLCDRMKRAEEQIPDALAKIITEYDLKGHFDLKIEYQPNPVEYPETNSRIIPRFSWNLQPQCNTQYN